MLVVDDVVSKVVDLVLVVVIAAELFKGHICSRVVLKSLVVEMTKRLRLDELPKVSVVVELLPLGTSGEVFAVALRHEDPIEVECDVSLDGGGMLVLLTTSAAY